MVVQELKNCFALLARHLIDMRGKSLVDVEKLSATLGVADYNRVIDQYYRFLRRLRASKALRLLLDRSRLVRLRPSFSPANLPLL